MSHNSMGSYWPGRLYQKRRPTGEAPKPSAMPTPETVKVLDLPVDALGRWVASAFCPVCDHAEEVRDDGQGQEQTRQRAIDKVLAHWVRRHTRAVRVN